MSTTTVTAPQRSRAQATWQVVACSLLVTAAAALVAVGVWLAADVRWSLVFVIARWCFVAALLVTPIVHQVATRLGLGMRMPWALQTPATALLLTCESIALDIASARLG